MPSMTPCRKEEDVEKDLNEKLINIGSLFLNDTIVKSILQVHVEWPRVGRSLMLHVLCSSNAIKCRVPTSKLLVTSFDLDVLRLCA